MASIYRNRSGNWECRIRRRGYAAQIATFDSKSDAERWARQTESEIDAGRFVSRTEAERTTFGEALARYEREVLPSLRGRAQDASIVRRLKKIPLAARPLALVRSADLAAYSAMLEAAGCAGNTIRIHLGLISRVFEAAKRRWGMESLVNPVAFAPRPRIAPGRDRRLRAGEEEKLLAAAAGDLRAAIVVAIETGLRRGELLRLRWDDIDLVARTAAIKQTKTGVPRVIPLAPRALETLTALPRRPDGKVFGWRDDHSVTQAFERLCHKLGIVDLRWHDLRHEATSRLFERGLSIEKVAAVTGHKTWAMLRRYTHPRAEDIARELAMRPESDAPMEPVNDSIKPALPL